MLILVDGKDAKQKAQSIFHDNMKAALKCEGEKNIRCPSRNFNAIVYSAGEGKIWFSYRIGCKLPIPRYLNSFGIYAPQQPSQRMVVEINVPYDCNTVKVAGFFAKDTDTGEIFLMHNGRIGGGKKGVTKKNFLCSCNKDSVDFRNGAKPLCGIKVAKVNSSNILEDISKFVKNVYDFKNKY